MDFTFERGDAQKPKGHALVYFRGSLDQSKVYATYVVVLPVTVDFAKYVPPFLVSHLGNAPIKEFNTFSLPPVPEEVESYGRLRELTEMREDDLIYGGTMSPNDLPGIMQAVNDVMQRYAQLWSERAAASSASGLLTGAPTLRVNEVMFSLLSERDRLEELSKLISKLRFAAEGPDHQMKAEAEEEIRMLARYLPEEYRVENLLRVAADTSRKGSRLAQLYLDRCYRLSEGDQAQARRLEQEIEALQTSG